MRKSDCLDDASASAFAGGVLDAETRSVAEEHLDGCVPCRRLVSALAKSSVRRSEGETGEETLDADSARLARGVAVGRFVVIGPVGVGGMGAVFAAYDPQLDRKVAIKVLHPNAAGRTEGHARGELLEEGQAMARVMHPNVVAVHEVGTFGSTVFIAMEFVDGHDLRVWLREERRPTAEILRVLVDAGRGLAAAHAVGLVHRDFKPDNVLVARDGCAKVTDFGLARGARPPDGGSAPPAERDISGTPAYMSPEQRAGGVLDARSDQYSFAVTLFEALYGELPSCAPGAPLRFPAARSDVRAPVRRAVARAIARDAKERFPSMDALVYELVVAPRRRARRMAVSLALFVLIASLGALGYRAHVARRELCAASEGRVAAVWNPTTKVAIRRRFDATPRAFAHQTWIAVEHSLDSFARAWAVDDRAACEATRVRKEQSEEVLALRSSCLQRRLDELRAITELLAIADQSTVENAVSAVGKLTPLEVCKSDAALAVQPMPPADPLVRVEVEKLRLVLAEVKALLDSGSYRAGLAKVEPCVATSERLGYGPVRAEALYLLGALRDEVSDSTGAEEVLYRAAEEAETSRHDEAAAKARTLLVWVVGYRQARHEVGHALAHSARGAVRRAGARPDLAAPLENHLGTILWAEGRYALARDHYDAACQLWERAFGPEHPLVADALNNRALALWNEGKLEPALASHEQALSLRLKLLGPQHPSVASSLNNIGLVAQDLARFEQARTLHHRAIDIETVAFGSEHPLVANAMNNLGLAQLGLGDNDAALESLERAYEIRKKTRADSHPDIANSLVNLAMAYAALRRPSAALASVEEAYARQTREGAGHPVLIETLLVYSSILRASSRQADALVRATEAGRLASSKLGPEHPLFAAALTAEGLSLLALGRPREATLRLDPVIARTEGLADGLVVGEAAFAMARSLRDARLDPERISACLELGRSRLRGAGPRGRDRLAELEAFAAAR